MNKPKFKFNNFDIFCIYGFITDPIDTISFNKLIKSQIKQKGSLIRNGWQAFYNMNMGSNIFIQNISIGADDFIEIIVDKFDRVGKKEPFSIKGKIEKFISIRRDGVGTLTLKFEFCKTEYKYLTPDILKVLMMIPRTSNYVNSGELTEINSKLEVPKVIEEKADWENLSFPFQLYIKTLIEDLPKSSNNILNWNPVFNGRKIHDHSDMKKTNIEELLFNTDSQMPYTFINSTIQMETYKDVFLDYYGLNVDSQIRLRKKYFKEISGILFRWLNYNNVQYIASDYWNNTGLTDDSYFKSRFVNSLVFMTFSGIGMIAITPDINESNYSSREKELMNMPIPITIQTILRNLELIRLRFHSAININNELDQLIGNICNNSSAGHITHGLKYLISIEEKSALNLENPSYNLWDSNIGSSITEYFNEKLINRIESDIGVKLNYTRDLLNDKLKYISTIDYFEIRETK